MEILPLSTLKNHLVNETSPYLLQHAGNPVDWHPWGDEALKKARSDDKPILVSIGYAACHWCHVMAHESFEDPVTAEIMNDLFICIKVDREERPDIDQIYMKYVQMTTGSGGWPLNVFLTPEQEPFYGGTYFPPQDRYGHPGWIKVLRSVSNFYHRRKDKLQENLAVIRSEFRKSQDAGSLSEIPGKELLSSAGSDLARLYDPVAGGFGSAPKFPAVYPLSLFLRLYKSLGDKKFLHMITHSLTQMANGGIYDQLGGGFARYSVDAKWLVPHFEKMLYDNAQLAPLYLETYLITGNDFFLQVAEDILAFVMNDLLSTEGGFYSSLDADSEGIEGKFYLWDKAEIDQVLGAERSDVFSFFYQVSERGNFENKNILHVREGISEVAGQLNISVQHLQNILHESKDILRVRRNKRVHPALDDKILTSWNGLMLSAFSRIYQVTRSQTYKKVIENNVAFLKKNLFRDGYLLRTYNKGKAKYRAFLDDYAFLIQGLLDAYEALFEDSYLVWARELLEHTNEKFWDSEFAGYYYTSADQEKLITRLKDEHDQSVPSGAAVMLLNNLRFYALTENSDLLSLAEKVIKKYAGRMRTNPYGYASYLLGLDFYLQKPKEIVLVLPEKAMAEDFLTTIYRNYIPNKVVVCLPEKEQSSVLSASLLSGKTPLQGKITAYVCQNFSCSPPLFSRADLKKLLTRQGSENNLPVAG